MFKVKLTDQHIKNGMQQVSTYIVASAVSGEGALAVLREERPEAFAFDPVVDVQPYRGRTVYLSCVMLKRKKARAA